MTDKEKKVCTTFHCSVGNGYRCCSSCEMSGDCNDKCLNSPDKCGMLLVESHRKKREERNNKNSESDKFLDFGNIKDKKAVSRTIKEVLVERNLSQADLADAVGVQKTTMGGYLHGDCQIRLEVFAKICMVLDLSMDEVMGLKGGDSK